MEPEVWDAVRAIARDEVALAAAPAAEPKAPVVAVISAPKPKAKPKAKPAAKKAPAKKAAKAVKTAIVVLAILFVGVGCAAGVAPSFADEPLGLIRPRNLDLSYEGAVWAFETTISTPRLEADAIVIETVTVGTGVDINPVVTANTSLRPVDITYNYAGAVDNAGGVDMDLFGYRVTITQTSSNDDADIGDRGYLQPIRSDLHINGFVDDAYAFYGKIYIDGDSTLNQGYGANLVIDNGAHAVTMDESGNLAGLGISINGSGDVTCGGTGYGKYSGIYVNWNQTTDLTVDSVAAYIGVQSGALLDSGYRVNASGTLTNSFHSYNSSGTMTNAINIEGAHTNAFSFPAEATAPVESHVADENSTGRIKITVGGADRYLYYYD